MSVMTVHRGRMISFDELLRTTPDIAIPIAAKLRSAGLGLLGTLRHDGSPRVSPIEVSFLDGRLFMGMMPGSRKLADVRRDPRVTLLTPIADRLDVSGEGKLVGHAVEVLRVDDRDRVLAAAAQVAGLDADAIAGSPVFELQVDAVSWQFVAGDVFVTWSSRAADGWSLRRRERRGAIDLPVDVAVSSDASSG